MAIGPIITRGYGTFSTVNKVPVRGYTSGAVAPVLARVIRGVLSFLGRNATLSYRGRPATLSYLTRTATISYRGRLSLLSYLTRTAKLGWPVPEIDQVLSPMWIGEDVSISFTLSSSSDPTGWTIQANFYPEKGMPAKALTGSVSGVSGSGTAWTATVTVSITSAKTLAFGPGTAKWQAHRTDSGSATLLGEGFVDVRTPKSPIP